MNETTRIYQSNDHQACLQIFKGNTPKYFAPEELADFETWLNGQDDGVLAYKTTQIEKFYVVLFNDTIVACGGYYIPRNETRANMVWGMVDSSYHNRGIGRRLLEYRMNKIKNEYPEYNISLDTTQHSYLFFEKLGFMVTKIANDYYGKDLDRYDMLQIPK